MANGNLPDVVQLLLCESAAYELASDSWVLIRPLWQLRPSDGADFPVELSRSTLYFQLLDAFGEFRLHIEIQNMHRPGQLSLLRRTEFYTIRMPESRVLVEDVVHLPPITFLEEGEYEFRLFADGQPLGSRSAVYLNVAGRTGP